MSRLASVITMFGRYQPSSLAEPDLELKQTWSIRRFFPSWHWNASQAGDPESLRTNPTKSTNQSLASASKASSTTSSRLEFHTRRTQGGSGHGCADEAAKTAISFPKPVAIGAITKTFAVPSPGHRVFSPDISFSKSTTLSVVSSPIGDSTSDKRSASCEAGSTALTSTDFATSPTAPLPMFQIQGIFLQPHVDDRFRMIFKEELMPRIKTELLRICRRDSWMLEFSMTGGCPELLAPSILVWCRDSDTKAQARKYFKEDTWLKEQLLIHNLVYHILDKPPRRCAKEVSTHQHILHSLEGSSLIVSADAVTPCGLDMVLPDGKRCTVGGLITIDDVPYLLTSRHGLDKSLKSPTIASSIARATGIRHQSSYSDQSSAALDAKDAQSPSHRSYISTGAVASGYYAREPEYFIPQGAAVHAVRMLYSPIPTHGQSLFDLPTDDFDWAVVELSDAPIALLDRVLKPNLVGGKEIQGIHVANCNMADQHPVSVVTADMKQTTGLLTNIYSTLQVDGSLHDVMLITLDKPMLPGASGTWVTRAGLVCGFIVAARDDLPWAYMIPMHAAIEDMKKTLRTTNVRIPAITEIDKLREQFTSNYCGVTGQETSDLLDPAGAHGESRPGLGSSVSASGHEIRVHSTEDVYSIVSLSNDCINSGSHSPGSFAIPEATHTFDQSKRPKPNSLNIRSLSRSCDWPLSKKHYSPLVEKVERSPRTALLSAIILYTIITIFSAALPAAILLALTLGNRINTDDSLFDQVPNSKSLSDRSAILVTMSATRIVFVGSWASTLAHFLIGLCIVLTGSKRALRTFRTLSKPGQGALPCAPQLGFGFPVSLCFPSIRRQQWYFSNCKHVGVNVPPVLKHAAQILFSIVIVATLVLVTESTFDYAISTISTIDFDRVTVLGTRDLYGRGLSSQCLSMNRNANFGLPCSRNGFLAIDDNETYVKNQNEISLLTHGTSNISEVRLVNSSRISDTKVAMIMPRSHNLSPFVDYRANTIGITTECNLVSNRCNWTNFGPSKVLSQFNCTDSFFGVLGKSPVMSSNNTTITNDPDVPHLGFKPGAAMQFAFFMDSDLTLPYNTAGYEPPVTEPYNTIGYEPLVMPDNQLINPVYFALAARLPATDRPVGVDFSESPFVHTGATENVDLALSCQYTTYDIEYCWVNSTVHISAMSPSLNGTVAEIFHGYNLIGQSSVFDSNLQDSIHKGAIQNSLKELVESFAESYSIAAMSVIGPFLSGRENLLQQIRTPLLVAEVPKAPLAILAFCCLADVVLTALAVVMVCRTLNEVDVGDLAGRVVSAALDPHEFRDESTEGQPVDKDGSRHVVFDECNIGSKVMRGDVEASDD